MALVDWVIGLSLVEGHQTLSIHFISLMQSRKHKMGLIRSSTEMAVHKALC